MKRLSLGKRVNRNENGSGGKMQNVDRQSQEFFILNRRIDSGAFANGYF
jgi:hypothetical protein